MTPKRELFGDCTTVLSEAPSKTNNACPQGWTFVEATQGKCPALGLIGGKQSLCERSSWSKPRWQCCLESDGADENCEPGYCKANVDSPNCQAELDKRCLTDVTQLLTRTCREYVQRESNTGRKDVIAAVQKYCKTSDVSFDDLLCRCVNADDPDLCYDDNCWARRNPQMRHLRYCAADECKVPRKGVFQPTGTFAECADICAPALKIENTEISATEATTLFNACQGQWNQPQTQQFLQSAAGSVRDLSGSNAEQREAQLRNLLGVEPPAGTESGNGTKSGDGGNGGSPPMESGEPLLPTWAWIAIGVGTGLLLIILIVALYAVTRKRRAPVASYQYAASAPGIAYAPQPSIPSAAQSFSTTSQ